MATLTSILGAAGAKQSIEFRGQLFFIEPAVISLLAHFESWLIEQEIRDKHADASVLVDLGVITQDELKAQLKEVAAEGRRGKYSPNAPLMRALLEANPDMAEGDSPEAKHNADLLERLDTAGLSRSLLIRARLRWLELALGTDEPTALAIMSDPATRDEVTRKLQQGVADHFPDPKQ